MAKLVQLVHKVLKEILVHRAHKVFRVQLVHKVQEAKLVHKVRRGHKDKKAIRVTLVLKVHRV